MHATVNARLAGWGWDLLDRQGQTGNSLIFFSWLLSLFLDGDLSAAENPPDVCVRGWMDGCCLHGACVLTWRCGMVRVCWSWAVSRCAPSRTSRRSREVVGGGECWLDGSVDSDDGNWQCPPWLLASLPNPANGFSRGCCLSPWSKTRHGSELVAVAGFAASAHPSRLFPILGTSPFAVLQCSIHLRIERSRGTVKFSFVRPGFQYRPFC